MTNLKDILIVNLSDVYCREFLSSLPPDSWNKFILIDYHRNSPEDIQRLDDFRNQGINYSSGVLHITTFANPMDNNELYIGTLHNPESWNYIEQQKALKFCELCVKFVHPESDRVRIFQDAMCLDSRISSRCLTSLLACRTIKQLEGTYAKLLREGILNLAEQKATEELAQEAGVTINISKPVLVCLER